MKSVWAAAGDCETDGHRRVVKHQEHKCDARHKGDRGFRHPVDLGDISRFPCTDCHAGKVWTKSR